MPNLTLSGQLRKHADDLLTNEGANVSKLRTALFQAANRLGIEQRKYDSTVARIAGNIMSSWGSILLDRAEVRDGAVQVAVQTARAIVAGVIRTEPEPK